MLHETDSESVLKTSKWKYVIIFIIINHVTSKTQTVWNVFQQSALPLLYNAIDLTLSQVVGTARWHGLGVLTAVQCCENYNHNIIIFIIINHVTSKTQTVWNVFQQSTLPLLYNAIDLTLSQVVGAARWHGLSVLTAVQCCENYNHNIITCLTAGFTQRDETTCWQMLAITDVSCNVAD